MLRYWHHPESGSYFSGGHDDHSPAYSGCDELSFDEYKRLAGLTVIVCGGREYDNRKNVFEQLDRMRAKHNIFKVIQGGARGADALAKAWAINRGVPMIEERADWNRFGKAAGWMRNQRMIDEHRPEACIAFPGGRGTADMVRRARAAGLHIKTYW